MSNIVFIILLFCVASVEAQEKQKITFIANPISHALKGHDLDALVQKNLDTTRYEYSILYTQYAQHATELAVVALQNGADIIAAVGGDGTVNEVGQALVHTEGTLAIIPVGSGNGLARHLGIPVGLEPAIQAFNHAERIIIDTAKINDKIFLNVAGIGFDARIAWRFANFGRRGFLSYSQLVIQEFFKYKPNFYHLVVDGTRIDTKAFILSFANSSQYGNDFKIAPQAHIQDGYLDLVVVEDISLSAIVSLLYQFKSGKLDRSPLFKTYRFQELILQQSEIEAHVDGEPISFHDQIKVKVEQQSLRVLIPQKMVNK